eukprot:2095732-Rhodomonas_salina.1
MMITDVCLMAAGFDMATTEPFLPITVRGQHLTVGCLSTRSCLVFCFWILITRVASLYCDGDSCQGPIQAATSDIDARSGRCADGAGDSRLLHRTHRALADRGLRAGERSILQTMAAPGEIPVALLSLRTCRFRT